MIDNRILALGDVLKFEWYPSEIREEERAQLFFYLKRRTSFTAWQRTGNAFDAFIETVRKQNTHETYVIGTPIDTYWQPILDELLQTQAKYQRGLARLRQGDQAPWRRSDPDDLDACNSVGLAWQAKLSGNDNAAPEDVLHGDYLAEMLAAIDVFVLSLRDIGYTQGMKLRGKATAPHWWDDWMICLLANEAYPHHPPAGVTPRKLGAFLPYPDPLPPAPEIPDKTGKNSLFSGSIVPANGIYEAMQSNGCMNYLQQGSRAPPYGWFPYFRADDYPIGPIPNSGTDTRWRLIWEDRRYLDGEVPAEEAAYFLDDPYFDEFQVAPAVTPGKSSAALTAQIEHIRQQANADGLVMLTGKIDNLEASNAAAKFEISDEAEIRLPPPQPPPPSRDENGGDGIPGMAQFSNPYDAEFAVFVQFTIDELPVAGWLASWPFREGDTVQIAAQWQDSYFQIYAVTRPRDRIIGLYPGCARGSAAIIVKAVKDWMLWAVLLPSAIVFGFMVYNHGASVLNDSHPYAICAWIAGLALAPFALHVRHRMPHCRLAEKTFRALGWRHVSFVDLVRSAKALKTKKDPTDYGHGYYRHDR
jgi:hypothetical protein